MKHMLNLLLIAFATVVLMTVTGCEKKGPLEKAGAAVEDAAKKTGTAIKDAAEDTKDAVKDATN